MIMNIQFHGCPSFDSETVVNQAVGYHGQQIGGDDHLIYSQITGRAVGVHYTFSKRQAWGDSRCFFVFLFLPWFFLKSDN